MDHWKTESEKADFLKEVNAKFTIPSDCPANFQKIKTYPALTKRLLIQNYIESSLFRRNILIRTINIHTWLDPSCIQLNFGIKARKQSLDGCSIVAHIRNALPIQGVEQQRNLNITYYLTLIEAIIGELGREGIPYTVTILTDYPKFDLAFPLELISLADLPFWSLTDEVLAKSKIEIKGFDIQHLHFPSDPHIKVLHGNNPLEAFDIMGTADFLIMSRSKFSIVGGYLNSKGKVIMPPEIGASVIPESWIPARKFIKIQPSWYESKHPTLTLLKKARIVRWISALVRFLIKFIRTLTKVRGSN